MSAFIRAVISGAISGDNELVAAVADKCIQVLSMEFTTAGAVTIRFESGAGGTALCGVQSIAANGDKTLPHNPLGWYCTARGESLNMELGGAVQVSGSLIYELI